MARFALVHPDLGIGGAERLVVDIATGLQKEGHQVEIFTSFFDEDRAFSETKDGTVKVTVLGDVLPRSFGGRFTVVLAILRQIHLVLLFVLAQVWGRVSKKTIEAKAKKDDEKEANALSRGLVARGPISQPFDVIIVDALSAGVPLFEVFTEAAVVFYCHFPDLLLSEKGSRVKQLYRWPIDTLEELTTRAADAIVVNSKYTKGVFKETFRSIEKEPYVVYPGIDVEKLAARNTTGERHWLLQSSATTILSINRFEAKKNLPLVINAFSEFKKRKPKGTYRLVVAGGYDPRLFGNVATLASLRSQAEGLGLSTYTYWETSSNDSEVYRTTPPPESDDDLDVVFVLNLDDALKTPLIKTALALLYSPENEHFGIVPLEAMAFGTVVLATNSGGPTETIVDKKTGFLLPANDVAPWAQTLLELTTSDRVALAEAAKERVQTLFSVDALAKGIIEASKAASVARNYRIRDFRNLPFATIAIGFFILSFSAYTLFFHTLD